MVVAGDNQETQILEADSPSLDPICELDDNVDEKLKDNRSALETQVLDDPDSPAGVDNEVIGDWVDTQLLYDCKGMDDDDGRDASSMSTEMLSIDEGLSDDGTTTCGGETEKLDVELSLEGRTTGENTNLGEHKGDSSVDSDASTAEEGGAGFPRKRLTSVRVASIRSSGLAAALKFTKTSSASFPSTFGEDRHHRETDSGQDKSIPAVGLHALPNGKDDSNSSGDFVREFLGQEINNFHGRTHNYYKDGAKNRSNSLRVKKLFNDATLETNESNKKADFCNVLASDCSIAGLSYIGSQEPGDLSQANALEVVDKFILVNDAGLSEEANAGKTDDLVKSPPVSSKKGVQRLAEKVDHRSPVGKARVFDWVDGLEDEGGGEFFSKRKDSFFESRGVIGKSQSHPPKPKRATYGVTEVSSDKRAKKEESARVCPKTTNLAHSDSRLMVRSEMVHETKARKNLLNDLDEQLNAASVEQQKVVVNAGAHDIGPDTQIAVEAMEALVQGSPARFALEGNTHLLSGNMGGNSIVTGVKSRSGRGSRRSRASCNSGDITTRSKKKSMLCDKSGDVPPILPEKDFGDPRVENSVQEPTLQQTKHMERRISEQRNKNAKNIGNNMFDGLVSKDVVATNGNFSTEKLSLEHHISCTPVARRTRNSRRINMSKQSDTLSNNERLFRLDANKSESIAREDAIGNVVPLLEDKESLVVACHANARTVARRARHLKRNSLLDPTETSANVVKDTDKLIDDSSKAVETENKTIAGEFGPVNGSIKSPMSSLDQTTKDGDGRAHATCGNAMNTERPSKVKGRSDFLMEDAILHLKQGKAGHLTPPKPHLRSNSSSLYTLDSLTPTSLEKPSKKRRIFIKSASELLNHAKWARREKKNSSKDDIVSSKTGKLPILSSTLTRSSAVSPLLGTVSESNCKRPVQKETALADSAKYQATDSVNHGMEPNELERSKQAVDAVYSGEDGEINKLDRSPSKKIQNSASALTTPSKAINEVSPVFTPQHLPKTRHSAMSRSSVARELLKLDISEPLSNRRLTDLRRRKDMASTCVLLSHHLDEDTVKQQKKILMRLGVPVASSMTEATHFVADKFARTKNMLEAVALGKPVVTPAWLESCGQASCFIDERNYILRDARKEKEIGFNMPSSLASACELPLLRDKRVFISPNVKPSREVISSLVIASSGQLIKRIGRSTMKEQRIPDDLLVVSCEEDYEICVPFLERGAGVFSSELLLNGIVIQKLEYERHRLFSDHVRRTRSTIWLKDKDGRRFVPVPRNG